MPLQERHGGKPVAGVVIGGDLLEHELRTVVLLHHLDSTWFILHCDGRAPRYEIEPVHRLVVLAHVIEALGGSEVIVERHAWGDHVDEGRSLVFNGRLDQRHQLLFVA